MRPVVTHCGALVDGGAIERRALWLADADREFPNIPLHDALPLVHLYAERGSPKYEKAANCRQASRREVPDSCGADATRGPY